MPTLVPGLTEHAPVQSCLTVKLPLNSESNVVRKFGMSIDEAPTDSLGRGTRLSSGLLALRLIAQHFGRDVTISQLARDNNLHSVDVTVGDLVRCSAGIGLKARGIQLSWESLRNARKIFPLIAQLKNGAYLVIRRMDNDPEGLRLIAQDPCCISEEDALLVFDQTEFERVWNGQIVLAKRNYSLRDEDQPFGVQLVASMIAKERAVVRDIAICAAMLSFLALAPIIFWRIITERVLQYHAISTFWVLCLAMIFLVIFETAFAFFRRNLLVGLTTRVDIKLATYMFDRVMGLPVDFFEINPTGHTLHRMGQIGRIRSFLMGQLFGTVLDAGILIIFFPVMAFFSPLLTGIVIGLCALITFIIVFSLPTLRRYGSAVEGAEAARGAFLAQNIHGIRTVKTLALDTRQRHQWDVLTARMAEARIAHGRFSNYLQSAVLPLERLVVSGSLAVGVYLALTKQDPVAVGSLFAFLMLSQRVSAPLIQVSQLIQQYDEARIAIGVVAGLVNQPPEGGRDGSGVRKTLRGHVEFSGVTFQYRGALRPALRDISFEVPQGTTLGVMGRSGSGKTTITRLLQRLHSDYNGLIKIDGVDVRQYDVDHLRASLGVVLQENFLFSGTIRENITIAKPDATYDDMVAAARLAGAEEFIDKLPAGYETFIYEGSPNLSGGQRQRLAIARALITDPKILILDEATSALDAESEAVVNANIDRIAHGRTVITISHRLSSLVKADAIMVLDKGVIDDIGRHEELLERNDIYAGLWYTQNQHAGPSRPAPPSRPKLAYSGPSS